MIWVRVTGKRKRSQVDWTSRTRTIDTTFRYTASAPPGLSLRILVVWLFTRSLSPSHQHPSLHPFQDLELCRHATGSNTRLARPPQTKPRALSVCQPGFHRRSTILQSVRHPISHPVSCLDFSISRAPVSTLPNLVTVLDINEILHKYARRGF